MEKVAESTSAAELLPWIATPPGPQSSPSSVRGAATKSPPRPVPPGTHRHAQELVQFARTRSPDLEAPAEPAFATRDPSVVGSIEAGDDTLFDAMERLEVDRVSRYEARRRPGGDEPWTVLDGLLERHLADALARLVALRQIRARYPIAA